MKVKCLSLCLIGVLFVSFTGLAQDLSSGRVWGIGISIIPATSFEVGDFSFPTFTISLRYWSANRFGIEGDFTFALKKATSQTPSLGMDATVQVKGLYKFADTEETDFYFGSGVVARFRDEVFSLPAFRFDLGAEFNANPNTSTHWEFGYGFRLLGEGDFLDRITTGIGWGRHFYPSRQGQGGAQ